MTVPGWSTMADRTQKTATMGLLRGNRIPSAHFHGTVLIAVHSPIQVRNRGLQKPLIFKGFKGKFIYIGGACIISALLLCAIVSTLASFMWGGITLVIVMFGGLGITSKLQRKGLHKKDKRKGIYIVSRTFVRDRKK